MTAPRTGFASVREYPLVVVWGQFGLGLRGNAFNNECRSRKFPQSLGYEGLIL
jgi:hypothetical protein